MLDFDDLGALGLGLLVISYAVVLGVVGFVVSHRFSSKMRLTSR